MSKQNPGTKFSLQHLLDGFRRAAADEREKGTYFEELIQQSCLATGKSGISKCRARQAHYGLRHRQNFHLA